MTTRITTATTTSKARARPGEGSIFPYKNGRYAGYVWITTLSGERTAPRQWSHHRVGWALRSRAGASDQSGRTPHPPRDRGITPRQSLC
jgi:hypothetical protein